MSTRKIYRSGVALIFHLHSMMTSSNGNIFRVTGHRSPVNSPHKGHWRGALIFSLICAWINGWVNSREAGDMRCHRAHYDVIGKPSYMRYSVTNAVNYMLKRLLVLQIFSGLIPQKVSLPGRWPILYRCLKKSTEYCRPLDIDMIG